MMPGELIPGAAFGFGYLLGAIPFGVLVTRLAGMPDIRSIGSGNIGATNVLRTGRKDLAAATLACDALKGTAAVLLAGLWGPDAALLAGAGAFVGHLFPVWLGFKGGKGVATFLGVLYGLAWPVGLAVCGVWLAVAALTRYSSLAALGASAASAPLLWGSGRPREAAMFAAITILLWVMHRGNIARLIAGTETRIGHRAG